jgi:hypothetical protein
VRRHRQPPRKKMFSGVRLGRMGLGSRSFSPPAPLLLLLWSCLLLPPPPLPSLSPVPRPSGFVRSLSSSCLVGPSSSRVGRPSGRTPSRSGAGAGEDEEADDGALGSVASPTCFCPGDSVGGWEPWGLEPRPVSFAEVGATELVTRRPDGGRFPSLSLGDAAGKG